MIIFLCILIAYYCKNFLRSNIKTKFFTPKKLTTFNKKNFNSWMNLTKTERYNLSKKESITYLNKRTVLLKEIRKEYKKISKGKTK